MEYVKYKLVTKKEIEEVYAFSVSIDQETAKRFNRNDLRHLVRAYIIDPFYPELKCRIKLVEDEESFKAHVYTLEEIDVVKVLNANETKEIYTKTDCRNQ